MNASIKEVTHEENQGLRIYWQAMEMYLSRIESQFHSLQNDFFLKYVFSLIEMLTGHVSGGNWESSELVLAGASDNVPLWVSTWSLESQALGTGTLFALY